MTGSDRIGFEIQFYYSPAMQPERFYSDSWVLDIFVWEMMILVANAHTVLTDIMTTRFFQMLVMGYF